MKKFLVVLVAALVMMATGAMSYGGAVVHADECQNGAVVNGNAMNNVLNGGPLNNIVRGFEGDDVLYGGACNDHLNGGPGYDKCYGGPGVDTFANCEVVVQ